DQLRDPRIDYWLFNEYKENTVPWTEVADALERGEIEQVVQAYFEPYHTLKQYIFTIVTTSGDDQLIYWWAHEGHKLNRKNCKKVIKDIRQHKFKARENEVNHIEEIAKKNHKIY